MDSKLDVLIFAAHPDDAELAVGGMICKLVEQGKSVGIIDLTRGELGSRGSAELRDEEALASARILGLSVRENLRFRDGFFIQDEAHQLAIIQMVRRFQPEIVIANAPEDRHPDHGRGSKLVRDAVFLSGLRKIETEWEGTSQLHWRPKRLFFYIQDYNLTPDVVVDITPWFEQKMKAVAAFASQFYDPNSKEPNTYISSPEFWNFLEARARNVGHLVGVKYGEGLLSETPVHVQSPLDLL
ncbi:MAG: bacillithiol biosynthesis deacetylase BshB1 [Bacteroidota bacterium]